MNIEKVKKQIRQKIHNQHKLILRLVDWHGRSYYWLKILNSLVTAFLFHITQDSYWLFISYQIYFSIPSYNDYSYRVFVTRMKDWYLRRIG